MMTDYVDVEFLRSFAFYGPTGSVYNIITTRPIHVLYVQLRLVCCTKTSNLGGLNSYQFSIRFAQISRVI